MNSRWTFGIVVLCALAAFTYGDKCIAPQVESEYYTTTDATIVSKLAAISVFTVQCQGSTDISNLYVDLNGKIVPAIKSIDNKNKFQISWTEEPKKLSSGTYVIKVYDEDGYAAVRKAQRNEEDISAVPHLFTLDVYHSGTYNGPYFQSEFVATVLSVLIYYWAYTAKSKLSNA